MKDTIESFVINGSLSRNADLLKKAIKNREGKAILITVQEVSRKRTSRQNRYIHRLFTILTSELNDLGNTFSMEQVKAICAYKFLLVEEVDESTGQIIGQRTRGTSELNTSEFNDYFTKVIVWAMETFGIDLPYPDSELTSVTDK